LLDWLTRGVGLFAGLAYSRSWLVCWIGLLAELACLLDWMRLASSKARGLENEQVPCSAGETPAIQPCYQCQAP